MYKFLPVGLLLVNILWASIPQPAHALSLRFCRNPDGTLDAPSHKLTTPEELQREREQRGEELARIAIAFYHIKKLDQMQAVNQKIASADYSPDRMKVLSALQMMMVGNPEAALPQLSNVNLSEQDATAIVAQIARLSERDRATWVLKAVDRLPNRMSQVKLTWLLASAKQHPNRIEVLQLLTKAQSLLPKESQLDKWIDLAEVYRKVGESQTARSILESVIKQGLTQGKTAEVSLAHAMAGNLDEAQKLIQSITVSDAQDRVRSAIAERFAERGDVTLSYQFLKQISNPTLKYLTPPIVVQKLVQAGKLVGAYTIVQDRQNFHPSHRQGALAWIAYRAAQENQKALSDRIIAALRGSDLTSLIQAAQSLNQVGYKEPAQTLLIEAIALAKQTGNHSLLPSLAGTLAETGGTQQANQILDEQLAAFDRKPEESLLPRSIPTPIVFPPLEQSSLSHFFQEGWSVLNSTQAKQLHKPNSDQFLLSVPPPQKDVKAIAYGSFAKEYSRTRNFAKTNQLLQQIPERYCKFRASIFQELTAQATIARDSEVALTAMAQISNSQEHRKFVRSQLLAIALFYIEANKLAEASSLLEHLVASPN